MNQKLIVFIIDESSNKIILSNNFSNVDVKYVLINYNNKDKPLIKSCKYSNVSIQNENKDSFEIFLNTNQPKLIYLTIPKLTNIVENYINSSNKDIFIFSNQSLQIKNNNCILNKSMKIDKFLSFAFENLGIKIDNPIVVKPLKERALEVKPLKEIALEVKPLKEIALEERKLEEIELEERKLEEIELEEIELEKNQEKRFKKNPSTYHFYKFIEICLKMLPDICDVTTKEIKTNGFFEAVFIEFRILSHCECIIKNCVEKLNNSWSHTIICGNDNYRYMESIRDRINKNIKIIKLDISKTTHNDYNNLLLTKEFWNMLTGEKILIYQSDSFIFKRNLFHFQEWDYIGAPFQINCIEGHNVGNGGLSLRSKSKMIEVLDKVELCNNVYSDFVNKYKKKTQLDNYPEDIVFSQNIQKLNIGKVADFETAKKFCIDGIYYEDSFGMHAMWHCCKDWEEKLYLKVKIKNDKNDKNDENDLVQENLPNIINTDFGGYLNEKHIHFTRKMYTENSDFLAVMNKIDINNISDCVLIIDFFNGGGGTTQFINYIISKYKYYNNFLVVRNIDKKIYLTLNDDYLIDILNSEQEFFMFIENINIIQIFVNHLLGFSNGFLYELYILKKEKNIKMTTITHDYYMIYNVIQPTYKLLEGNNLKSSIVDINFFDTIVTQHETNLELISDKIIDKSKIKIIALPDYYNRQELITNTNSVKTIGILGNINEFKGGYELKKLIDTMPEIHFVVFGLFNYTKINLTVKSYNDINELNNLLIEYEPHALLELSLWPETYSFVLTLCILTNLKLIILDKPLNSVCINRTKKLHSNYVIAKDFSDVTNNIQILDINNISFYTISPRLFYNSSWNEMFISGYNKYINNSTLSVNNEKTNHLEKYVIYFPQFHYFDVNNTLFYNNFTDIINLKKLKNSNYLNEILTPNANNFNLNNIEEYNIVENGNIMEKEYELLMDYNLDGFACYYYWFSKNSVNNDNMIMRESVNRLFETGKKYDKKIFFIWANENWTNNAAMGETNESIINIYSLNDFILNFNNMLEYFNNDMYLKYENKPVLMVYHSFLFNNNELEIFENKMNELSIEHGFSGIKIYWNIIKPLDILNKDTQYNEFYINFNYKINEGFRYLIDDQAVIDYEKYIEFCETTIKNNIVQTLIFDFDNHARLFEPDRTKFSTICIKNYHFLKVKMMKMLLSKYSETKENIILINSFNEWGEKMAIEPSNEIGFYYLNLLKNNF